MSEKFTDRWLEASLLAENADGVARDQLIEAIDWVQRAAPENGINLAPWWEARLEREARLLNRRRRHWPMALAAGLLIGLAVGVTAGASIGGRRARVPAEHYSERQRQLMFAVLEAAPGAEMMSASSAELVGCFECHEAPRRRAAARLVRPAPSDQSSAAPTWRRTTVVTDKKEITICRQAPVAKSGGQFAGWSASWLAVTAGTSSAIRSPGPLRRRSEMPARNPQRLLSSAPPPVPHRSNATAS